MNRKIMLSFFALVLAVMACNIQPATSAPTESSLTPSIETPKPATPPLAITATPTVMSPFPTPTNPAASVTSMPNDLSLDMLKNGTYFAPSYKRTVTLVNGSYSEGSGGNSYSVRMLDAYAFGDLNGDGKADAAVLLAENGGGSGVFVSLVAVLNQAGTPQQNQAELGDRVLVNSADISSGVIHLDMTVPGPNDPSCCPTLPQIQSFWLIDNQLWLMHLTSTINGTKHEIVVESPGIWTTNVNPFTVNGSVTVLPFENTLAYRIFLTDDTKVNENPITVTPTTGTSGTFTHDFNLTSAGITDWVIIQFVEISAADGSTIALGSVILKAK
jgi:hypothetical protein